MITLIIKNFYWLTFLSSSYHKIANFFINKISFIKPTSLRFTSTSSQSIYTTLKLAPQTAVRIPGSSLLLNYTTLKPQINRFKSITFTRRGNLCFIIVIMSFYDRSLLYVTADRSIFYTFCRCRRDKRR